MVHLFDFIYVFLTSVGACKTRAALVAMAMAEEARRCSDVKDVLRSVSVAGRQGPPP